MNEYYKPVKVNDLFEDFSDPSYFWYTYGSFLPPCKMKIGEEFESVYIYSITHIRDFDFLITYSNKKFSIKYFPGTHKFPCGPREKKITIEQLSEKSYFWYHFGESVECVIDGKVVNIFKVNKISENNYSVTYSEGNLEEIYKKGNERVLLRGCPPENLVKNTCTLSGGKSRPRKSRKSRPRKSRKRR